jgi:hypothetical protein
MTLSVPAVVRRPLALLVLALIEFLLVLLLSSIPVSARGWPGSALQPKTVVMLFVGLLAFALMALRSTSSLVRRYRRNGELRPIPFVPAVDVPLLAVILIELALLAQMAVWRVQDWRVVGLAFFSFVLLVFGLPRVGARLLRRPIVHAASLEPLDPLDFRDNPIAAEECDLLDRSDFLIRWTNQMTATRRSASSIYGFFGPQGGGKTSALLLLRRHLEASENGGFLVVAFDPWYFTGPSALVDSFYGAIDKAVSRLYLLPNLRRLLARYTATIKAGLPWPRFAEISVSGRDLEVAELKARIEDLLVRIPERVVLLIDDLDRVPGADFETVLRLVRLTGDFPNLIVILSCDPVRLRKSPGDQLSTPSLLEKTAQTVVTLPPASRQVLDQYLYFSSPPEETPARLSAIDRLLRHWNVPSARVTAFEKEFTTYFQLEFRFGFNTIREAKRYLASLQLSLANLWPEVNLFDYFLLEYVKVFAIDVWTDIWTHSNLWVGSDLKRGFGLMPSVLEDERKDLVLFRAHIEKLLGNRANREFLSGILGKLFPRAAGALAKGKPSYSSLAFSEQRIQSWEHFGKYFRQAMDRGDVPDQEIRDLLETITAAPGGEEVERLVKAAFEVYRLSHSLKRFLEKLEAYSANLPGTARAAIVRAIALGSDQLSLKGWRDFDSEFDAARHLVLSATDSIWQTEGPDLMRFVVTHAPRISFALVVFSYTVGGPTQTGYSNLRSPELFESLRPRVLQRLEQRFGPGREDLLGAEGDNTIYVLIMWSRLGKGDARPNLEALVDARPELWARIAKAYLDPFGELRLKDLTNDFDPAWLGAVGERHRESLQTDPAALRVLELLGTYRTQAAEDPP